MQQEDKTQITKLLIQTEKIQIYSLGCYITYK